MSQTILCIRESSDCFLLLHGAPKAGTYFWLNTKLKNGNNSLSVYWKEFQEGQSSKGNVMTKFSELH